MLERWLRDGVPLDPNTEEGRIALAGISHLPAPKTGEVEQAFSYSFQGESWEFFGYIDWQDQTTVIDHKTTGNLKWAKTPDVLKTDVQATIYAGSKFALNPDLDEVQLKWIYYRTKRSAKSVAMKLNVTREETEKRLLPIIDTAREIVAVRKSAESALDLQPNAHECDAFGGCPYVKHCNLSSVERMSAIMAQHTLAEKLEQENKVTSLADKLRAKAAAGSATITDKGTEEKGNINPPTTKESADTAAEKPAAQAVSIDTDEFLRDRFALGAMQGILSARSIGISKVNEIAGEAYAIADAMMKAR